MSDGFAQVALVAGAAAAVVIVALATRRWQRPTHERVDISGLGFPPGIVIFTSTDCSRCRDALAVVRKLGVSAREVTWELEPQVLERARVSAVPLTLVVAETGSIADQVVGVPRTSRLRRSLARARRTGG